MNTLPLVLDLHAEEAAFLALLRDHALRAPHYDLDDLDKLEQRIDAHLDGLRIAGARGQEVLLAQLGPRAVGEMFASVVLAFEAEDAPLLARLSEHLRTAVDTERGYLMALGWLDWQWLLPWIESMLASSEPLFRRLGLAACGMHRYDPGPALLAGLCAAEPQLLARAARTAGELRRHDLMANIRLHRLHQEDATRFWANWATAQMGDQSALELLRPFAEQPGEFQYRALCVLLAWQQREPSIAWIRQLLEHPEQRRIGIQAIGLLGDPAGVPWLIQQMSEPPYARVAGEAFSLITGADLALLDLELQDPPDFDAGPNDDPHDAHVAMDPDENLPWPAPQAIAAWWQAHGGHFQAGVGYIGGLAQNQNNFRQVLARGQQRQRLAAACGLARFQPNEALFPTSAPTRRQQRLLGNTAKSGRWTGANA